MRVLLITQYFPPEIGAAPSRWGDYTNILTANGHEVTVLCEIPNYPSGKYYNGYKNQWFKKEIAKENLTIIRTLAFATDRKTKLKKIIHYLTFMVSGLIYSNKLRNFDLIIVSSPPLFVGLIGLYMKIIKSKPYWLDIRDLWPDSAIAIGQIKKGILFKFGKKLEYWIYKNAQGFIFAVPDFKNYFNLNFNNLDKPMHNLINGVNNNFIKKAAKLSPFPDKRFVVLYSGNIGLAQSLETIIMAAEKLKDLPIDFRIIGNGIQSSMLKKMVKIKKLKNVFFQESIPRDQLMKCIEKSSVCLAPLGKSPLFRNALPSKIFEYMACRRPVICNDGSAGNIINEFEAGIVVESENFKKLARAIETYFNNQKLISIHGNAGFNYIKNNLIKEDLLDRLINKLKK